MKRLYLKLKYEFNNKASDVTHKSVLRQKYELLYLLLERQFTPAEYYAYRFYEKDKKYGDMVKYISNSTLLDVIIPTLNKNSWMNIHDNKWLFHLYYDNFEIPITEVYGYYNYNGGLCKDGTSLSSPIDLKRFFRTMKPKNLVIKPVGGRCGKGILIFKNIEYYKNGNIEFITMADNQYNLDQVCHYIVNIQLNPKYPGVLLEKKVEQHSFFNNINPFTMNDIRIVTLMDKNNEVKIIFTGNRLGRKGSETANWARGGLSVYVDPETGVLGKGWQNPEYGGIWTEYHPDTKVKFKGQVIPMWNQIKSLSKKIATLTPELKIVGWDLVLTPTGPVVIEGNPIFNIEGVQANELRYSLDSVWEDLSEYGIRFKYKGFSLSKAILLYKAMKRWSRL